MKLDMKYLAHKIKFDKERCQYGITAVYDDIRILGHLKCYPISNSYQENIYVPLKNNEFLKAYKINAPTHLAYCIPTYYNI